MRQSGVGGDAQKILDLVRDHVLAGASLPTVWVPGKETRDDREVVRQRITVADKRCKVKTQIPSLLKRFDLRKPQEVKSAWNNAFDSWLRQLAVGTLDKAIPELAHEARYESAEREQTQEAGVGVLTSVAFLSELGDVTRFRNRRQIAAYWGLAHSCFESGNSDDRKGHITRQGPSPI